MSSNFPIRRARISASFTKLALSTCAFAFMASLAQAENSKSGADALMEGITGESTDATPVTQQVGKTNTPGSHAASGKVDDPFTRYFAHELGGAQVPFDIRNWGNLLLAGEIAHAAHLWTAISPQIPASFRNQAYAGHLYTMWRLGLGQTFTDVFVQNLGTQGFLGSGAETALEKTIVTGFDRWVWDFAILISPQERQVLDHAKSQSSAPSTVVLTYQALSDLRQPKAAEAIIAKLPEDNRLRPMLAETVALARLRANDLKGAGQVIKTYLEPSVKHIGDPILLAQEDLLVARILFQAGQMTAAGDFYRKIPNTLPTYLQAREELTWVYLRQNDSVKWRGELKGLTSALFNDRFAPEVSVLRAISDLKMCFYDEVQKDITSFEQDNLKWAKAIDSATAKSDPPKPPVIDPYTDLAMRRVALRSGELGRIKQLGQESITAVLPAVGEQRHWRDYELKIQANLQESKKVQADEFRREWKNDRIALAEAIRKMRFVKIEFLSEVQKLGSLEPADAAKNKIASNDEIQAKELVKNVDGQMNFPVKGEIWPDELFKLKSAAQSQCLRKRGG